MRFMRSPLPRAVLTRLETGRLVVLSVLMGTLVGGLSILLRLTLDALAPLGPLLTGYSPPGTPGEGGLLMVFGDARPWGLLALPVAISAISLLWFRWIEWPLFNRAAASGWARRLTGHPAR